MNKFRSISTVSIDINGHGQIELLPVLFSDTNGIASKIVPTWYGAELVSQYQAHPPRVDRFEAACFEDACVSAILASDALAALIRAGITLGGE